MGSLKTRLPADYISGLTVGKLNGRIAKVPSQDEHQNRQILFVYGQHSSIERWWGLIEDLSRYGTVIAPDLPGYGGMDSLYSIGIEPTFDALADYLADFIRQQFGDTNFDIVGLSIGFAIVTRMLERHPEIVKQVGLLVSAVGFAHHDDFIFSRTRQTFYKYGSLFFLHRPLYKILEHVVFSPLVLRRVYHRSYNAKEKFANLSNDEFLRTMDMELHLWKVNDVRTWLRSNVQMFDIDNCKANVALSVLHLSVRKDRYFDLRQVEKHYRQIFDDYEHVQLDTDSHGPSVIATPQEAAVLVPHELQKRFVTR